MTRGAWKRKQNETLFCRSYVVTLGLVAIVCGLIIGFGAENSDPTRISTAIILSVFLASGAAIVLYGLIGPSKGIKRLANATVTNWNAPVLAMLAFPIYLALEKYYKSK